MKQKGPTELSRQEDRTAGPEENAMTPAGLEPATGCFPFGRNSSRFVVRGSQEYPAGVALSPGCDNRGRQSGIPHHVGTAATVSVCQFRHGVIERRPYSGLERIASRRPPCQAWRPAERLAAGCSHHPQTTRSRGGGDRTRDLKVMSLASYHCSTPLNSRHPDCSRCRRPKKKRRRVSDGG